MTGVALVLLLGGGAPTTVATAATSADPPQVVTVDGDGQVEGTPDVLRLVSAVSVTGPTVVAAEQEANRRAGLVIASLQHDGVAAADIQTSNLSIGPNYDAHGTITGFAVYEELSARLRDLGRAGAEVDHVVAAAGNATRIEMLAPDLEATGSLLAQARAKAFADAKAKAEQYAQLAGRHLGAVHTVSETTTQEPMPMMANGAMAGAAGTAGVPVPVVPGSVPVSVHVTVVFDLV